MLAVELEVDMDSEEVARKLVPIAERLFISPSKTAVENMGNKPSRCIAMKKGGKDEEQGFRLRFRTHGGPGRLTAV